MSAMLMDVRRLKETALSQVSMTPENGDTIPVDTVLGQARMPTSIRERKGKSERRNSKRRKKQYAFMYIYKYTISCTRMHTIMYIHRHKQAAATACTYRQTVTDIQKLMHMYIHVRRLPREQPHGVPC